MTARALPTSMIVTEFFDFKSNTVVVVVGVVYLFEQNNDNELTSK